MAIGVRTTRTELDTRSDDYAEVTLIWVSGDGVDETLVCVHMKEEGTYYEIATEPYLALDVFNHPFAYLDSPSRPETTVSSRRRTTFADLKEQP
jgi:hypothetical protein